MASSEITLEAVPAARDITADAGKLLTVTNLPMGLTPTFSLDMSMARNGKVLTGPAPSH